MKLRNPWGWPRKTNVKNITPDGEFTMNLTEFGLYLERITIS